MLAWYAEARASDITNEHRNQAEPSPAWHFCRSCCMSDTVASACWTTAKSFMVCSEILPSRCSDDVEKHTYSWTRPGTRGAGQPQRETDGISRNLLFGQPPVMARRLSALDWMPDRRSSVNL